ncbi:MAG: hypothetical protein RLZZ244_143, partial [Verrucomicrobiota bacterium]
MTASRLQARPFLVTQNDKLS